MYLCIKGVCTLMPNVEYIIRAEDFSRAGIKAGAVVPFYNVTLSGRYPIF